MEPSKIVGIARLAVRPFAITWLCMLAAVEPVAFIAALETSDAYRFSAAAAAATGIVLPVYLLFLIARLALAKGNLIYVSDSTLFHVETWFRSWRLDDVDSVALADSPVFEGRQDQLVLCLRSGESVRLSAIFSSDEPADILDRLNGLLTR